MKRFHHYIPKLFQVHRDQFGSGKGVITNVLQMGVPVREAVAENLPLAFSLQPKQS